MSATERCDVVIVGAGPAGSTAATLLAEAGHRVIVLEKDEFPRFHIGESLLPAGGPVQARLGIAPDPSTFLYKRGAQFICEDTGRVGKFWFDEALEGPPRHAWHVERATFDAKLRDRARQAGADVRHGQKVSDVDLAEDHVEVRTQSGAVRARYVIDATGQDRLLARKGKHVSPFGRYGKAAVFSHFEGLPDVALEEIGEGNDIRIMMVREGWAWFIPLPGRRLSVGIVSRLKGIDEPMFDRYVESSPILQRWTAGATRSDVRIVRNYSYRNTAPYGPRYACIGDAACFLDPVFSSGVALAMVSAERLADALGAALAEGREADPALAAPLGEHMERAYATFGSLIDRFYNTRFADNVFFGAPEDVSLRRGVISVLAGDVWRDDNPFQRMLLKARRRRAAGM